MLCLGLDTCFASCSAGLVTREGDGALRTLALQTATPGRGHAEHLPTMIKDVLAAANCSARDLDLIAVTAGPGSFTGVRTALAAAEGLAAVTGCATRGVSSLHAYWHAWLMAQDGARDAQTSGPTLTLSGEAAAGRFGGVAVDARRDQAYVQAFMDDGAPLGPPRLTSCGADLFAADSASVHPAVILTDLAPALCRQPTDGPASDGETNCGQTNNGPAYHPLPKIGGDDVARIALRASDGAVLSDPARPLYLRAPDAKPQRLGLAGAVVE
ncbi:MAG: tRNA (adenosine(37)-N6)-threonylcarbamoyltransferase complex dimerization subunit type 1 TsaB [Pseudomonadota bacterium]